MTTTVWKNMVEKAPTDGSTVWVRMNVYNEIPFQASWDVASETFTAIDVNLTLPWWMVSRWRAL